MDRAIYKFSLAMIVTSILAAFIIPAVYNSRGYFDVGGEYILLGLIFAVICKIA